MRPPWPRSSIAWPISFVPRKQLVRLRSIDFCQISSGSVAIGTLTSRLPTLLIRMSIGPISASTRSHAAWHSAGTLMSAVHRPGLAPTRADLPGRLLERLRRPAGDHDVGAGIGERERHDAAEAAARARHERPLAVEPELGRARSSRHLFRIATPVRPAASPSSTSAILTGRFSASDRNVASIIAVTMRPSRAARLGRAPRRRRSRRSSGSARTGSPRPCRIASPTPTRTACGTGR